jgi:solute carrier family 8 (sodium/calcium exchanger)
LATSIDIHSFLSDTFASKVAAVGDDTADACIGNVTGSNAVNVFLGIGIAWFFAAVYHAAVGGIFYVNPGSLGFTITVYCIFAVIAFIIMLIRRNKYIGGELGGPHAVKIPTCCIYVTLWLMYILLSSLKEYCLIPGF